MDSEATEVELGEEREVLDEVEEEEEEEEEVTSVGWVEEAVFFLDAAQRGRREREQETERKMSVDERKGREEEERDHLR